MSPMPASCDSRSCLSERERSEEHTSELQSHLNLVCRLLLEKKKNTYHLQFKVLAKPSLPPEEKEHAAPAPKAIRLPRQPPQLQDPLLARSSPTTAPSVPTPV